MHKLTGTSWVEADEAAGSLDHWAAECSCGWKVGTTLGASSFECSDRFARAEMLDHVEFMNAKEAK